LQGDTTASQKKASLPGEGYGIALEVRRGEITQVELEADKPGIFRMASDLRLPSMVAQIVVLPNGE
jgi:hypothetical protein